MAPLTDAAPGSNHPAAGRLLIYDGGCGICTRLAVLAARFAEDRARIRAFQEVPEAELRRLGLSRKDCARRLRFREEGGRISGGAFAVNRFLLAAAPPGWRGSPVRTAVRLVVGFPPLLLLEIAAYELVARNRSRLGAWTGSPCETP